MRILQGHTGGVRALAYHPEGKLLASGGEDGCVVLWLNVDDTDGHVIRCATIARQRDERTARSFRILDRERGQEFLIVGEIVQPVRRQQESVAGTQLQR